ncbi:MAG TPA: M15 family metallopeptidase [Kiloniellales bacterium]|nr:M15 family metallopeptidase [Kiloniellales bacterium]
MRILVLGLLLMAHLSPANADDSPQALYGHLPYEEAPKETLVAFCHGSSNLLRKDVAQVVAVMVEAAQTEGVTLRPVSCFRSVAAQDWLFYGIAKQRGQTPEQRARVSAPPGHSEHHTGYAIDFGDQDRGADLDSAFAETPAGRWLLAHGTEYGFELSFPDGNAQGVAYEPWHWRYVGTPEALETFRWARQLYPANPSVPGP